MTLVFALLFCPLLWKGRRDPVKEVKEMVDNRSASFYEEQGILSWILSTDHKRIGLLYMSLS